MKVNFLLCEEVRQELYNKCSLLGFFAGDVIILDNKRAVGITEDLPIGIDKLVIVSIISDAQKGTFQIDGKILDPLNELYQNFSVGTVTAETGLSNTILFEIKPFVVKLYGTYVYELKIGNELFRYNFEVREQSLC